MIRIIPTITTVLIWAGVTILLHAFAKDLITGTQEDYSLATHNVVVTHYTHLTQQGFWILLAGIEALIFWIAVSALLDIWAPNEEEEQTEETSTETI